MTDAQEQYWWWPCLVINDMAKLGHEQGADNSDNAKQVIKILKRGHRISQDVIKNNLDKTQLDSQINMLSNLELLSL